jgi:hypothetical protein
VTELEQFRTMLARIGVEYEERPTTDWERGERDYQRSIADWEQRMGKSWQNRTPDDPYAERISYQPKPGWTSLFPDIGYIETELIFDPDGNLHGFEQHE